MRRLGLVALVIAVSVGLLAAPALALPSGPVGKPFGDVSGDEPELFEIVEGVVVCSDDMSVQPGEPFHVTRGWLLDPPHVDSEVPDGGTMVGGYTFEMLVNDVSQPSSLHVSVRPSAEGGTLIGRTFLFDFPNGLEAGDEVTAIWASPDGVELLCEYPALVGD